MISETFLIFASIAALFIFFLIARDITRWRFCALCAAVATTWLVFLAFHWFGITQDLILIAPLIGASAVGIYYLAERKTKESLHIFRLPFLLTLFFITYILLGAVRNYFESFLLLTVLWIFFGTMYAYKEKPKIKRLVARVIACCKNW